MPQQPEPAMSIFVSHTNDDELANTVLNKLVNAFSTKPPPCGLELVYDGCHISTGDAWRKRIYEWLDGCPAAIVLVSPGSFLRKKPWVSREAFYLAVRLAVQRNVLVIPVIVGDAKKQLVEKPEFEPAQTRELEWIDCPNPNDEHALAGVIDKVREALRSVQTPCPLNGLASALAAVLKLHPGALEPLAEALKLDHDRTNANTIALKLVSAPIGNVTEAIRAFARYADASDSAGRIAAFDHICDLMVAREVPESAARSLGLEMKKAPDEAMPVLIDSTRNDVAKFYVVRSAGCHDHGWTVLDVSLEAEEDVDAITQHFSRVLAKKFKTGEEIGDDEEDEQSAREMDQVTARHFRLLGQPVVFRVTVSTVQAARKLMAAWRASHSDCGLMLRRKNGRSAVEPWNEDWLRQLDPPVDSDQINALVSLRRGFDAFRPQPARS